MDKVIYKLAEGFNRLETEVQEFSQTIVLEKGKTFTTDLLGVIRHLDSLAEVVRVDKEAPAKKAGKDEGVVSGKVEMKADTVSGKAVEKAE